MRIKKAAGKILICLGFLFLAYAALKGAVWVVGVNMHGNIFGETYTGEAFATDYSKRIAVLFAIIVCVTAASIPKPTLYNMATILIPFAWLSSYSISGMIPDYKLTMTSIITSLIFVIVSRLVIFRKLRKLIDREAFIIYGTVSSIILVLTIIGLTGGFGYSRRIPQVDSIAAVQITYPGAPEFISGSGNYGARWLRIVKHLPPYDGAQGDSIVRDNRDLIFISEEDIRLVHGLHGSIINADEELIRLRVRIRYHLNDGRIIERMYKHIPAATALQMLMLDETDAVRENIASATSLAREVSESEFYEFFLTDSLFGSRTEIPVEHRLQLLEALQSDIENLSIEQKYFPSESARVILHIPRLIEIDGIIGKPQYEHFWDSVSRTIVARENGIRPQTPIPAHGTGPPFEPSERCMHQLQFFITSDYVNTIEFLQDAGYASLFDIIPTLEAQNIISMEAQLFSLLSTHRTTELFFRSSVLHDGRTALQTVNILENERLAVLNRARTHYYGISGGYRLLVDVLYEENLTRVALFLPRG
ncbi:MAG: hypothetical protein LBI27_08380 [Clostridiales bacterium]|nr:hypothetical protein [Clostridiales bacterium]